MHMFCPDGFEQRKLVRPIQSKSKDSRCDQLKDVVRRSKGCARK